MADGTRISRPSKRAVFSAHLQILKLIEADNLALIRTFFEELFPQCTTTLLNSTVHDNTLMFHAAFLGRFEICRYLLELSLRQGREELCRIWNTQRHPLAAAIVRNDRRIVELIIHNLHDINDAINGFYTPLLLAVLCGRIWVIKMVLDLGADVNLSCGPAGNPFVSHAGLSWCINSVRFLVEHGARIDQQDEHGFTALHVAVMADKMRTVLYLVEAGANVCIRSQKGYTPLILSTFLMTPHILNYFTGLSAYSVTAKIEAVEIFNAWLVLSGSRDIRSWLTALEMRHNRPKAILVPAREMYEFSVEFSTREELLTIRDNQLLLAYQGVLVVERIFGFFGSTYVRAIIQAARIAKKAGRFEKLWELICYIQTICQYQDAHAYILDELDVFKLLFSEITIVGESDECLRNGAFVLFQMVARTVSERWSLIKSRYIGRPFIDADDYFEIIDTFLHMVHIFTTLQITEDFKRFSAVVKKLAKDDPRVDNHQSLLHRAISAAQCNNWDSLELVKVLLEAGFDVNSKDYIRQTPLMYTMKRPFVDRCMELFGCLLEHGAHLDCQSSEGYYVNSFSCWETMSNVRHDPIDLSCQAVRVILDANLPYENMLPKILREFVDLHK